MKRTLCHVACLLGLLALAAPPVPPVTPAPLTSSGLSGSFPWPLGSGTDAYPLAQTYGQFEGGNGAGAGIHLGLDIYPEQSVEQVFALEDGIVKHVVCFEPYHSGLLVESLAQPGEGLLYLHLDPMSIQLGYNAGVQKGMLLGNLAAMSGSNLVGTHLHLARLAGYAAANLPVNELPFPPFDSQSIADPLKLIDPQWYADEVPPEIHGIFVRENDDAGADPAVLPDDGVAGVVDVFVHVTDVDGAGKSTLAPSAVLVEIKDENGGTVVHQASICLEGQLPSVEPIYNLFDPQESCGVGKCSPPEFYVIATNGSQDCTVLPSVSKGWTSDPGQYEVTVTAEDAAGNKSQKSTTIEVP